MNRKPQSVLLGSCTAYHGDCLELMTGIESPDMVLADLPYGTTRCRWDTPIDLSQMWRVMPRRKNTPVVLMAQTPFDKVLGCSNLDELRYEWIWEKPHPTGYLNAKRMPMKAHENVLVFYGSLPLYNPQMTTGHTRKVATKRHCGGNRLQSNIYGRQKSDTTYDSTDRYPRSVQVFSSDKQKTNVHETQKPVALMEYLIKTYTKPGETVLDFTMGSGTTGVACINTGRKFIGIELDKVYFDLAVNRIKEAEEIING